MYLQTGDEHQWMVRERQSREAGIVVRPVSRATFIKSRSTTGQSATCMDLGAVIGLAVAWVGRLFHPRPIG
jgi:hypothetical protein